MNVTTAAGPQGGINQTTTIKATTIDEKPLPESLFKIPADYREVTRPMMPGGSPGRPSRPGETGDGASATPHRPSSTVP